MCGRIVWVWDKKLQMFVKRWLDDPIEQEELKRVVEKKRYNVPPASHLPFLRADREGKVGLQVARWGFPIPQRPNGVFNTKIESAYDSPMWRGLIGKQHAVLTVNGFYEWKRDRKRKTPYLVTRADEEPMALAALTGLRNIDGEPRLCASVVTCEPNAFMAELHDRMPVILEANDVDDWLHPSGEKAQVLQLAVPAGDVLHKHQVTDRVNSTENDDPELIEPVGQKTLF